MIEEKEIREAERNIPNYLNEGLLTKNSAHSRFTPFYLDNAKMSLLVAQHLHQLSTDPEMKKHDGFPEGFECFLWVVVAAYYSMFYTANAGLAKLGLKVGETIAHRITQDCLVVYFLKNNRIAKALLESYKETKNEVLAVIGVTEEKLLKDFQLKASGLVETFAYQRKKRGEFQYDITRSAKEHVAQTALDRAKTFIQKMSKVIEVMK
jgi:uncharacterized protein (UPF0332 family)